MKKSIPAIVLIALFLGIYAAGWLNGTSPSSRLIAQHDERDDEDLPPALLAKLHSGANHVANPAKCSQCKAQGIKAKRRKAKLEAEAHGGDKHVADVSTCSQCQAAADEARLAEEARAKLKADQLRLAEEAKAKLKADQERLDSEAKGEPVGVEEPVPADDPPLVAATDPSPAASTKSVTLKGKAWVKAKLKARRTAKCGSLAQSEHWVTVKVKAKQNCQFYGVIDRSITVTLPDRRVGADCANHAGKTLYRVYTGDPNKKAKKVEKKAVEAEEHMNRLPPEDPGHVDQ